MTDQTLLNYANPAKGPNPCTLFAGQYTAAGSRPCHDSLGTTNRGGQPLLQAFGASDTGIRAASAQSVDW